MAAQEGTDMNPKDPSNVTSALDDVGNGDDYVGEPVEAEHDLDVSTFEEEHDDA